MPKKVDANQKDIVKGLRKAGCSVVILSMVGHGCGDILCGRQGKNYFFEIKNYLLPPSARKLTPCEQKFFDEWLGQISIIHSVEEALNIMQK